MILDTSVLFDVLVSGVMSGEARDFLASGVDVRAPDLLAIEIASALTRAVRRYQLTAAEAQSALARARRIGPELDATAPLLDRAFALSLELAHPVSDCVFLAHAEANADVLVTSDSHFARKVAASPHASLILELSAWRPQNPA